jgi:hypothetical protein
MRISRLIFLIFMTKVLIKKKNSHKTSPNMNQSEKKIKGKNPIPTQMEIISTFKGVMKKTFLSKNWKKSIK